MTSKHAPNNNEPSKINSSGGEYAFMILLNLLEQRTSWAKAF
jgi:hypothetical protein